MQQLAQFPVHIAGDCQQRGEPPAAALCVSGPHGLKDGPCDAEVIGVVVVAQLVRAQRKASVDNPNFHIVAVDVGVMQVPISGVSATAITMAIIIVVRSVGKHVGMHCK